MKPWMRQQHATKAAAATPAAAPAAGSTTDAAAPAAPPKKRVVNLPTIGRVVHVFGIERDGLPVAAIVQGVNADTNEVNVTGGRRNGNPFGQAHVAFPDQDEGPPENGVFAAWMPYQLKAETNQPTPASST